MTLFDALGFRWDGSAVPTSIPSHSIERVCFRFHKMLPEFVWDASVLEGNPFTFPEVKTLLDGVTIGGRKISDQEQVLNLAESSKRLLAMLTRSSRAITTAMLKDLEGLWMRDDLIETLRDCANALGELLPRDHAYRKIVDQANRLLGRHDQSSSEQRAADALRDLMDALPAGTQTSMTAFRPEVNGQKAGTVKALLIAENADDLRCAQWVITNGSAKRGEEQWPL